MGRLIDADAFLQNLINCDIGRKSLEKVIEAVKKQPTAYDPEKVVEQLEKEKNPIYREVESIMSDRQSIKIDKAIEIVKGGGVDGN
jgi:hypothetical protein